MELLGKIIRSRLAWEILAAVVVVCVLVGFMEQISGWFGMKSRVQFEESLAPFKAAATKQQGLADAAQKKVEGLVTAQQALDKRNADLTKAIAAVVAARPNKTEVLKADAQQIITDRGMALQIARVLGIQPDRVGFSAGPCGPAATQ